jgi:hypothetical protein
METQDTKENDPPTVGDTSAKIAAGITGVTIQQLLREHQIEVDREELLEEIKNIVTAGVAAGGAMMFDWLCEQQDRIMAAPSMQILGMLYPDSIETLKHGFRLERNACATFGATIHDVCTKTHDEYVSSRGLNVEGEPLAKEEP